MQNLREPSPLNNATVNAPEFFYQAAAEYDGRAGFDTQAGVGWKVDQAKSNSREAAGPHQQQQQRSPQQGVGQVWDARQPGYTGSRNAFAEQAERTREVQRRDDQTTTSQKTSREGRGPSADHQIGTATAVVFHKRTPSGTAIVQASKQRYSHHQQQASADSISRTPATPPNSKRRGIAVVENVQPQSRPSDDDVRSESGDTVYEDAASEPQAPVVPHEDREDAFDYKEFFLSSAMKAYGGKRRASESQSASGESSASTVTARGPTAAADGPDDGDSFIDDEDEDDEHEYGDNEDFMPSSPETPERLRKIERNLGIPKHERNVSETSVSTLATFATATEGRQTPSPPMSSGNAFADQERQRVTPGGWPTTISSRPSTAIPVPKQLSPLARSEGDASERADSGVGGFPAQGQGKRPGSSQSSRRTILRPSSAGTSTGSKTSTARSAGLASPPTSPRAFTDPATAVVSALLGEGARLGLRDKKVLFGVVEGLMGVCRDLREDEAALPGVGREERERRRRRARSRLESLGRDLAEG